MSEKEMIKLLESRTREDVIKILKSRCLGGKYHFGDYSEAKRVVLQGRWIDSDIYDKQIGWICEYLGI